MDYHKILCNRFHLIPTAVGFCMLVKTILFQRYGLFSYEYGFGYNEENDFSQRINKRGYSIVSSNHAYVYHQGSASFKEDKILYEKYNKIILNKKYPHYNKILCNYIKSSECNKERFLINDNLQSVLIDLSGVPSFHNGTSEFCLKITQEIYGLLTSDISMTILIPNDSYNFHYNSLNHIKSVKIIHDINGGFYNVCFRPCQFWNHENFFTIRKSCKNLILVIQDIISIRCNYIKDESYESLLFDSFNKCDHAIFISEFSRQDFLNYFNNTSKKSLVIHHGVDNQISLFNQNYILLVGNHYSHKCLKEFLLSINSKVNQKIFCIGFNFYGNDLKLDIEFFESGSLTNNFVSKLYQNASLIIFPSDYEGFGLPISKALSYGKEIILLKNQLNIELYNHFDKPNNFILVDSFSEISNVIKTRTKFRSNFNNKKFSWKTVADKYLDLIKNELTRPSLLPSPTSPLVNQIGKPPFFKIPTDEQPLFLKLRQKIYNSLSGDGLEIGVFEHPAKLPSSCTVKYFDRFQPNEAKEIFPEISHKKLPKVDIIGDLDEKGIAQIPNESFEFVIMNHVLEHLFDPIQAIKESLRILKPGGSLVMSVPDKRFTFDFERKLTKWELLLKRYQKELKKPKLENYEEIYNVHPNLKGKTLSKKEKISFLKECIERREHLNVWDSTTFKKFLMRTLKFIEVEVNFEKEVSGDESHFEYLVHLKKIAFSCPNLNLDSYKSSLDVFSLHVPKTGGTSFSKCLSEIYGKNFIPHYPELEKQGMESLDALINGKCVHGHLILDRYQELCQEAELVTWLRNPVGRTVSLYLHILSNPDSNNEFHERVYMDKPSILEFCEMPENQNQLFYWIGDRNPEDFKFIGFLETAQASIVKCSSALGWTHVPNFPWNNKTPKRNIFQVSPREREFIKAKNQEEIIWINKAKEIFG